MLRHILDHTPAKLPSRAELLKLHKAGKEMSLHGGFGGNFGGALLRAAVYGANDGIVTTFAVVAGVAGAQLSDNIIIILGIANMVADGLSMALGDYLGSRSEYAFQKKQLKMEHWEYEQIPEIERKEIERMYIEKGYSSADAKTLVGIHERNPDHLVELGYQSEIGELPDEHAALWHTGMITFWAFVIAGSFPLLPYFLHTVGVPIAPEQQFPLSIMTTGATMFVIGSLRTLVVGGGWLKNGLEMLLIGSLATGVAYLLGSFIHQFMG